MYICGSLTSSWLAGIHLQGKDVGVSVVDGLTIHLRNGICSSLKMWRWVASSCGIQW